MVQPKRVSKSEGVWVRNPFSKTRASIVQFTVNKQLGMSVRYEHVSAKRAKWLKSFHNADHCRLQDHISARFPNSCIVAMPGTFVFWSDLSRSPIVVPQCVKQVAGAPRDCHDNALHLKRAHQIDDVWSGYALSEDGLWRFHSWGCQSELIVETTEPRLAYWGCRTA